MGLRSLATVIALVMPLIKVAKNTY